MRRLVTSVLATSCVLCTIAIAGSAQAPVVYKPGNGVVAPRLVHDVKPQYTADAMRAKVQGKVELEFVVLADGTVGDVKVVRSLHPDLDREAVKAINRWMFKPGTKDGEPVAVQVSAELTFTMGDPRKKLSLPAPPADNPPPPGAVESGKAIIYKPGQGVSAPRVIQEVKPIYPTAAKEAKTQGSVLLEAVVEADGTVGDVWVTRSLDPALDEEAIKAAKQWRFKPGTRDGKPVPVEVGIELTFALKN